MDARHNPSFKINIPSRRNVKTNKKKSIQDAFNMRSEKTRPKPKTKKVPPISFKIKRPSFEPKSSTLSQVPPKSEKEQKAKNSAQTMPEMALNSENAKIQNCREGTRTASPPKEETDDELCLEYNDFFVPSYPPISISAHKEGRVPRSQSPPQSFLAKEKEDIDGTSFFLQLPPHLPYPQNAAAGDDPVAEEGCLDTDLNALPGGLFGEIVVLKTGQLKLKIGEVHLNVKQSDQRNISEETLAVNKTSRNYENLGSCQTKLVCSLDVASLLQSLSVA